MKTVIGFLFVLTILTVQGCSKETVKRATYSGAQMVGQQQCQQEFSADCPEPDSYEEYQRKRRELQTSE
jgi:hypothetical protein